MSTPAPLVLHILYRFDTGGLENGVVNLINHMPRSRYRHAVLAIDNVVPAFASRIQGDNVAFHALHKPPGHGLAQYPAAWRLMRALRPAIVHSRNLAALEFQLPAALAGVPARVHSEHGRDVEDLHGEVRKLQRLRRAYSGLIDQYVTVSQDLKTYLVDKVGVGPACVAQIYNGVDTQRFSPCVGDPPAIDGCPFAAPGHFLFGTVGRMQFVKNQSLLAQAFVRALELQPAFGVNARLVMVGDGPLRAESLAVLGAAGAAHLAWLPGERSDVPQVMRGLHCFVLPSRSEGVSNTILEAMASGLPVIATAVGGSVEIVQDGVTGELVPSEDVEAMACALLRMVSERARLRQMQQQARSVAEQRFSLDAMVGAYADLYDQTLSRSGRGWLRRRWPLA